MLCRIATVHGQGENDVSALVAVLTLVQVEVVGGLMDMVREMV